MIPNIMANKVSRMICVVVLVANMAETEGDIHRWGWVLLAVQGLSGVKGLTRWYNVSL